MRGFLAVLLLIIRGSGGFPDFFCSLGVRRLGDCLGVLELSGRSGPGALDVLPAPPGLGSGQLDLDFGAVGREEAIIPGSRFRGVPGCWSDRFFRSRPLPRGGSWTSCHLSGVWPSRGSYPRAGPVLGAMEQRWAGSGLRWSLWASGARIPYRSFGSLGRRCSWSSSASDCEGFSFCLCSMVPRFRWLFVGPVGLFPSCSSCALTRCLFPGRFLGRWGRREIFLRACLDRRLHLSVSFGSCPGFGLGATVPPP